MENGYNGKTREKRKVMLKSNEQVICLNVTENRCNNGATNLHEKACQPTTSTANGNNNERLLECSTRCHRVSFTFIFHHHRFTVPFFLLVSLPHLFEHRDNTVKVILGTQNCLPNLFEDGYIWGQEQRKWENKNYDTTFGDHFSVQVHLSLPLPLALPLCRPLLTQSQVDWWQIKMYANLYRKRQTLSRVSVATTQPSITCQIHILIEFFSRKVLIVRSTDAFGISNHASVFVLSRFAICFKFPAHLFS